MLTIVKAWRVNGDTILLSGIGRLVILLARLGHHEGAARLYGAATREIQLGALVPGLEAEITQLRATMGAEVFDSARAIGAALSLATKQPPIWPLNLSSPPRPNSPRIVRMPEDGRVVDDTFT